MKKNVLGLSFDALTMPEAVETALRLVRSRAGGFIVTANPEMQLRARKDAALCETVNAANLVLADGIGTVISSRLLGDALPERVTGADLVPALLEKLAADGGSVFLYGAKSGVAERAADVLREKYPGLRIIGTENGYISDDSELILKLRELRPNILLVGLGAPRQELWMQKNAPSLSGTLCIGVGGLFDVFAGDLRRAPVRWQKLGLEWLYRLLQEPRRISRILPIPLVFFYAVRERFSGKKDAPSRGAGRKC